MQHSGVCRRAGCTAPCNTHSLSPRPPCRGPSSLSACLDAAWTPGQTRGDTFMWGEEVRSCGVRARVDVRDAPRAATPTQCHPGPRAGVHAPPPPAAALHGPRDKPGVTLLCGVRKCVLAACGRVSTCGMRRAPQHPLTVTPAPCRGPRGHAACRSAAWSPGQARGDTFMWSGEVRSLGAGWGPHMPQAAPSRLTPRPSALSMTDPRGTREHSVKGSKHDTRIHFSGAGVAGRRHGQGTGRGVSRRPRGFRGSE